MMSGNVAALARYLKTNTKIDQAAAAQTSGSRPHISRADAGCIQSV